MKNELTKLLGNLVNIPSFVDKNQSELQIQNFLSNWFKENLPDLAKKEIPVIENRKNILFLGNNTQILFCIHMDTVGPVKGSAPKLIVKSDKAFGLGTKDMKGGAVCAMLATKYLDAGNRSKVGFLFYCDEEYLQLGIQAMLKKKLMIPKTVKFLLTPETKFTISFATRGFILLTLLFRGKRAHTARPFLGKNAIEIAMCSEPVVQKFFTKLDNKATISIVSMYGGVEQNGEIVQMTNITPDIATTTFSIRSINKKITPQLITEKLGKLLKKYCSDIELQITTFREPSKQNNTAWVSKLKNAASKTGKDVRISDPNMSGYNDIAILSNGTNIPFVGFGPYGENNHAANEWVSLQSMLDTTKIFKETIKDL